ncbi:MAG: TonB-dependent receptor, partial [Flavisolibacter sp.]
MLFKSLQAIFIFLVLHSSASAQTVRLFGTITSTRGETIIGASVTDSITGTGTITNEYGFYSMELPAGRQRIIVTAIGKKTFEKETAFNSDARLDLVMEDLSRDLEVVVIRSNAQRRNIRTPQMSMERINVAEIRNVPVLFGERDILKTMQLLPGVKSAGEGNSGFYVRGGAADQNLVLLDEAPVYNASHLFGFFSTFNSDAIKNVTLYKGGMPAQYGGRLSSVVDIKMNDGNNQDFGMSGGIGLIASRLNLEGPLQKGRSSFLLSGRRTYADLFLKLLGDTTLKKAQLYFYDLNAKVNYILNENNRLYLSGYFGRDVLKQDKLTGIDWGNATGTLRWNHIFNTRLFSNTSLIHSNYDYRININSESAGYRITSRIRDWNLKQEFQWHA